MRAGADVIYQATFARDGWRGRADFLDPRRRAVRPRRLELRGLGHEARALARSRPRCSSSPGTRRRSRAIQGRLPERLHVVLGTSDVETYRPGDVDAFLRTAQRRLARARRRSRPDLPVAVRALLALRLRPGLPRALGGRRPPDARRVDPARPDRASSNDGRRHDARRPRARRRRPARAAALAPPMLERLRDQAGAPAPPLPHRRAHATACSSPRSGAGSGSCRRRRRATSSSTWRATRSSSPAGGLEFLFGVLWREPDGAIDYRPFWAHDRDGERRAFEQFVDLVRERRASYPGHARLPLRRLRALDARAAHGRARDARGGDRRAPPRRGLRRPAPGRPPGPARRRRAPTR